MRIQISYERSFMIRRKQILTHRGIQIRLASYAVLGLLVFVVLYGIIFMYTYRLGSQETELMAIHDQLLTKTILVSHSQNLLLWYGLGALVYFAGLWIFIIRYSHRMTGPIFKLVQILDRATEENKLPEKLQFRKGDAFTDLEQSFNAFIDSLQKPKA